MKSGMEQLQQHKVQLREYWRLAAAAASSSSSDPAAGGQQPDLDKITFYGKAPQYPTEDITTITLEQQQNLPGWDATFDDVNLHLHGMQVVPHLFYVSRPSIQWVDLGSMNKSVLYFFFKLIDDFSSIIASRNW